MLGGADALAGMRQTTEEQRVCGRSPDERCYVGPFFTFQVVPSDLRTRVMV